MQIILNRGGELWWMSQIPDGPRLCLRYGIRQPVWSYVVTFGSITKLDDGDCVPCTDDGEALLYKAKWGPAYGDVSYMETLEQAMDIVLHMSRNHAGYLRQPEKGSRWCSHMRPFDTNRYTWERVQC